MGAPIPDRPGEWTEIWNRRKTVSATDGTHTRQNEKHLVPEKNRKGKKKKGGGGTRPAFSGPAWSRGCTRDARKAEKGKGLEIKRDYTDIMSLRELLLVLSQITQRPGTHGAGNKGRAGVLKDSCFISVTSRSQGKKKTKPARRLFTV